MLRDTSAASTSNRSTSSAACAVAGASTPPVKINTTRNLIMGIIAPSPSIKVNDGQNSTSQVQTKLRRCLLAVPPSIPDNAAWREGHLDQRAGVRCALYGEIGAIGLSQRFGQRQAEAGSARAPASGRGDLA